MRAIPPNQGQSRSPAPDAVGTTGPLTKKYPLLKRDETDGSGGGCAAIECVNCHYDLRAHALTDRCPECGLDVRRSVDPFTLRTAPLPWLLRVSKGLVIIDVAFITAAIGVCVLVAGSFEFPSSVSSVVALITILAIVGGTPGVWLLTTPCIPDDLISARRVCRCCGCLWPVVFLVALALSFAAPANSPALGYSVCAAATVLAIMNCAYARLCGQLMRQSVRRDASLAFATECLAAALTAIIILGITAMIVIGYSAGPGACGVAVAFIAECLIVMLFIPMTASALADVSEAIDYQTKSETLSVPTNRDAEVGGD